MAKVFRSYIEMQKGLEVYVQKALHTVANKVFDEWKEMIRVRVYEQNMLRKNKSNTSLYDRTYELLESLSVKVVGTRAEIYYDTDKINAYENNGRWNSHMSFSGEDVSELLPTFIEYGNNSSKYSYKGIYAYDEIIDMLNSSYNDMLKQELIKQGLKVQ